MSRRRGRAKRTAGAMNTLHEACWAATAAGVDSSRGSPGTITPWMTLAGMEKRVARDVPRRYWWPVERVRPLAGIAGRVGPAPAQQARGNRTR